MNWPDPESLPDLSDHQREKYALAARGCLGILGGRPGGGKTFVAARVVKSLPSSRLAVCGPTGKAAVRITETMQRAGAAGIRATTIHTLLGPGRDDDDNWSFDHNEENPLDLDFILLDEGSMVDTSLMGSLLAARAPGCKVLICGDVNQLSPVGPGAPLRDFIDAKLPYGELREIRRNSGRIVKCCHGIVDRHVFEPSPALDLAAESPENLLHIERSDPEQQIEIVKTMLDRFRAGSTLQVRNPKGEIEQRKVSPVWDCQILVPVNDKSPLGRKKLNTILQGFLNPGGERVVGSLFRKGDKIVNGKNGWMPAEQIIPRNLQGLRGSDGQPVAWNQNLRDGKVYCANGEQADVLAVFPRYIVARLWTPDRIVRIPKGDAGYTSEDGEEVDTGCSWDLAYALSAHKSQGSQWPVIIALADAYAGARMLCDRSFWYTELSRAETLAVTVGEKVVIDSGIRKSHLWDRKTFLTEDVHSLEQESVVRSWEMALSE